MFTVLACSFDGCGGKHQAVANSKIEGVPEITFLDLSVGLKPAEQFRARPALGVHLGDQAVRQTARKVLGNASACDVGHGVKRSA